MFKPASLGNWSRVFVLLGTFGLLPSVSALAATADQTPQQQPIEEIVVTGSLLRKDSFNSSSPLTVIDQDSIANNATPNLGEVLVNQTFNYGSDFQTNTYAARPQVGSGTAANLRGLGERATLNLLDGKRGASVPTFRGGANLNQALPQIAIERIDILKDGASATYGSDAVAGVVNIIPRKNFSGAEASAFYQQDSHGDLDDKQYEMILGTDTSNGHVMFAASYSRRSTLAQTERPKYLRLGFERSDTGNPGVWNVARRDAAGNIVDAVPDNPAVPSTLGFQPEAPLRDPGCGVDGGLSPGDSDVGAKGNFLAGDPRDVVEYSLNLPAGIRGGQACAFHFGETWNFINPEEKTSIYANFQYEFSDTIRNEFEFVGSRLTTDSRGSPQNPGGRTEEFPIVLGDHPGNPFRALTSDGTPLYAQDANGDGVPDRETDPNSPTYDVNQDGVPDVILAPGDPTNSANGVPFNEDVDVVALRIFGKIGLLPDANQPTSLHADGSNTGNATYDSIGYRASDTLTVEIPNTSWEVNGTAIFARQHIVLEQKNTSQNALEAGLRGDLVALPATDPRSSDPSLSYWNPFATQALHCDNRVCSYTGTPDFANAVPVLDAINIQAHSITDGEFYSFDVLTTGDLFDLPAGTVQGAFGAEYRQIKTDVDESAQRNSCDWHEGGCAFDYKADQDVSSAYYEFSVPVVSGLDLTLAGRYTDVSGNVGSSFDPKFAALWQPIDMLSFRASWGSAFIAPDLIQLYSPETCGLQTFSDPLTNDNSGTFRVACVSGNKALKPEQADVYNIGFSIDLLDGNLTLGVDYADYDFQDRISTQTGNNVMRANFAAYLAAGNTAGDAAEIANWIATTEKQEGRIFRDSTGIVTRVITDRVNAQSMEQASWDFYGRYTLPFERFGTFTVNLAATYIDKYTFDLGTGDPQDSGDGVGKQNEQVAEIPPLPEWRVNGTLNWYMGNVSAYVRARWIDGFDLEYNSGGSVANASAATGGLAFLQQLRMQILGIGKTKVDPITYIDLNLKYTFDQLIGDRATTIEVGANNVTDEFPTPFFNLGGIETFVHDVRGRMWYVRLRQDL